MQRKDIKNALIVGSIISILAFSRLIDHTFNFTPINAIILFSAAFINNKYLKFILPFSVIILSDFMLELKNGYGFHAGTSNVYLAYLMVFIAGYFILKTVKVTTVIISALSSAIIFFLVTNFAYFYPEVPISNPELGQYSHNLAGILSSYKAGIPFFRNMVFGDMFFTSLLFGSYTLYLFRKLKVKKVKS